MLVPRVGELDDEQVATRQPVGRERSESILERARRVEQGSEVADVLVGEPNEDRIAERVRRNFRGRKRAMLVDARFVRGAQKVGA